MDSVVESLLNTLTILKKKRPEVNESCRDLLRLFTRCDIFFAVLVELKNHPMMLNDLSEAENELLYDLHTTIQNICTFIDDNVSRTDYKAITQLDFRLSYYTDLAQLNQKITQLIEALNLQEEIDLDRLRDEDLQDAKESFENIVRKVIKEISRPLNVFFDEEFDSLNQDIDNHEEALSKLLALLKHRPLSVAEAKVLKAEILKLKAVVQESRDEMKRKNQIGNPNDFYSSNSSAPGKVDRDSGSSKNLNRKLPSVPPSPVNSPHTSASSKSSFASSSSMINNGPSLLASSFRSVHLQQQTIPSRSSPQITAMFGQNQNNSQDSASGKSSQHNKLENYELTAKLLNRLLRNHEQLSAEEITQKKNLLESLTLLQTDLEVTKVRVGRGTFGDVCLGTLRNRYKVAIKTLKRSNDQRKDEQRRRLIEKEMLITKYLGSYPTIPVCYGFITMDSCIQVVFELAPYGSLSLILKDSNSFPILPAALKIAWLSDLTDAIRFLHSKEIMHKNVCADNVLVFEKLRIKLGDFGPEKSKGRSEGDIHAFLAPEVREGKNSEYGSDVYSFGMTAIQIFARRVPALEKPEDQILSAIDKEWIEPKESKDSLVSLLLHSFKSDDNRHINDVRPSSDELFQEILTILETIGGDPREESRCHDYSVVQELENVAKQKRNEMLRVKSSYKSNLSLRPNINAHRESPSSRRSFNLTGSSWLLRNSFHQSQSQQNGNNITSFSYSQFSKMPAATQEFLSNSIDIEDKASIAYFLIHAAKFTPLEADFMADRLVRKGVSCVSTLRRKLHRDPDYLATVGIDKETASRVQTAIFSIKSPTSPVGPAAVAYAGQTREQRSGVTPSSGSGRKKLLGAGSSSNMMNNEVEGNTDRDNESDSLDSVGGSSPRYGNKIKQTLPSKLQNRSLNSIKATSLKNFLSEKAMTAEEPDALVGNSNSPEETLVDDSFSPNESIQRLLQNSKQMMDKRNILSKFLRVEINLSPELANKYSDIMIAHEIYDLPSLQKRMMSDSKILVKYGFDKRISNTIFDHLTLQAIAKFQDDQQVNDIDMTLNPSNVPTSSSSLAPLAPSSSSAALKNYVTDNCAYDVAPADVANLYYEASQTSNADALEKLLEVAESGDYLAQGFLMRMYALGQSEVKRDVAVAQEMGRKLFPWLQHAIQTDNSSQIVMYARYLTGVCYSLGLGVAKNEVEAIKWYLQSAHQGYVGAQAYLGYCYYLGIGVEKDLREAFNWYKISALRGHSASQCNLGLCYENGHGVDRNLLEAIKWYRASAEQGDVIAQFSLGNLYEKGKKGVDQNFNEAFKYYKMSAERGYDQAQYCLGCCFYAGLGTEQNLEQAFYWFAQSAAANNAAAQCKVGFCYENGIGVEKNVKNAVEYYRVASIQQHPAAMYYLGYCFFTGIGVNANVAEAVRLYMASASKKYAAAQNNLGFCYFNGVGVNKDLTKAIEWYRLAADQEYPAAQYNLGYCYEKGLGVAADLRQSIVWYQQAAKNGHSRARKSLKRLNEQSAGEAQY